MYIAELSDKDFGKFKDLIYAESGIKLSDMKKALVQARLSKRLRTLKIQSFTEYYNYLINFYDEEKFDFINAITTNKTDFFRENKHFEFMRNVCLPDLVASDRKEIRIWSAGCSTGEEPYSIAMTLLEFFENRPTRPIIKILATDIDTHVLEKAYAGIYTLSQVEGIDVNILKKYFLKGTGENEGFFSVKKSLKDLISFRRLNLHEELYPMHRQFDIMFCRNVIIYFDKETQKRLFNKFYNYLADHGYLFIGHSENLASLTNRYSLVGNTIYRKNLLFLEEHGEASGG